MEQFCICIMHFSFVNTPPYTIVKRCFHWCFSYDSALFLLVGPVKSMVYWILFVNFLLKNFIGHIHWQVTVLCAEPFVTAPQNVFFRSANYLKLLSNALMSGLILTNSCFQTRMGYCGILHLKNCYLRPLKFQVLHHIWRKWRQCVPKVHHCEWLLESEVGRLLVLGEPARCQ